MSQKNTGKTTQITEPVMNDEGRRKFPTREDRDRARRRRWWHCLLERESWVALFQGIGNSVILGVGFFGFCPKNSLAAGGMTPASTANVLEQEQKNVSQLATNNSGSQKKFKITGFDSDEFNEESSTLSEASYHRALS